MFTNMFERQYNLGTTGLEQVAQKDIAGAYGNYIASQIQLKNVDDITAGYRKTLEQTLQNSYDKTVYDIDQTLQQDKNTLLTTVGQEIADYKASAESDIQKQAIKMVGYENDLLKHISKLEIDGEALTEKYPELFKFDSDEKLLGWSDDANRLIYEQADPNNPTSYKYSESGKNLMSYLLQDFDDWAKINYKPEDYSDWVETGRTYINNALFGSDMNPYSGDNSVVKNMADSIRFDKIMSDAETLGIKGVTSGTTLTEDEIKDIFPYENDISLM
jgi:hypothetical protein